MNKKNTIKINKNFSCFITNETDHLNLINKENKKSKTPKNLISIHKQKIINNKKNLSERLNKSTRIKNRINLNKIITKKNSFESDKNKLGFKSIKLFKRDFIDNSQKIKFQNELNGEIIYFSLYNDNDIFNLNEIYNENFNINLYDEEESSDDEKILSGRMFQLNEIGKEIKKMKK